MKRGKSGKNKGLKIKSLVIWGAGSPRVSATVFLLHHTEVFQAA